MKYFVLFFLLILQAKAEELNCQLALDLIEDSYSSEVKKLNFDVKINELSESIMSGAIISTTCFNVTADTFSSNLTTLSWEVDDNQLLLGHLRNSSIPIAEYHYQLEMKLTQAQVGDVFIANGKILSSDNENHIHQIIVGSCTLIRP